MSFVHLHTHTEYSMLDGAARVKQVVNRAVECDMPALAITDHGYMYGAVDFYKTARKAGIKPIVGCEVYFTPERRLSGGKPDLYHLLLLAKNDVGYRNLMALVSDAAVSGFYYKPQVDLALLEKYADGLIGTSACMSGIVSKSIELGMPDEARKWAETYASTFAPGDFYLEIQEQGIVADNGVSQKQLNTQIATIAHDLGLPLVATNDIHYLNREDAQTQDVLLCIGTGKTLDEEKRMRFSCDEFFFKSAEQMAAALPEYPEALANTLAIAEKCDVRIETGNIILPVFEVPEAHTTDSYLRERCIEGLKERYGDPVPDAVMERLDYELSVVLPKGIAAYFLIVADFVAWAKGAGIGVGPGRGSAAGSIISYSLGITNLDPISNGLLFERFLNPERTEMPDIDIDFDDERRGEVIEYVRDKYGSDKVCQIVTFGTLKARAAIRDAGRVLGYPYGVPDKISKAIPPTPLDITIDQAIWGEKGISANADLRAEYESNSDTKRILDSARAIEGITRNEGIHAAGVVICRDPLHFYTPLKKDTKGDAIVTQYEGNIIAELGLLKMDFLGLRTLTVIADAIRNIRENHGVSIVPDEIPLDDPATFDLLQRGDTAGVFQVESAGMRALLKEMKPTTFADIVAVLALYRPGPLNSGMVKDFVERKAGKRPVTYYDERLKPILEETYGAIVYQEQVMRISMTMSGFSAAKADKLRKAMGKKQLDVLAPLEKDWVEGAGANGFDPKLAQSLWADILPFAEYAFNKSHSAAYGLLTMQTAYLKAHYPLDYMAAVLTSYQGKTEKIVHYVSECNRAGMPVLPPDVNSSRLNFAAADGGIRFGLAGIRGVGEGVAEEIVKARSSGGEFTSLHDWCDRMDLTRVNKKTVEALVKAGAFDSTGYSRKQLMSLLDDAVDGAVKRQKDIDSGQGSIFDMLAAEDHGHATEVPPPDSDDEWPKKMRLAFEKEMLGIFVSDHPLRDIEDAVRDASDYSLGDIDELADGTSGWFAGLLSAVDRKPTKKGTMMAVVTLEDLDGSIEAVVFPQTLEKYRDLIAVDEVVRFKARLEDSDRGKKLIVSEVEPFDGEAFSKPPGRLIVETDAGALVNGRREKLVEILERYPGRDVVLLMIADAVAGKRFEAKMPQTVNRSATGLHAELLEVFGAGNVRDA